MRQTTGSRANSGVLALIIILGLAVRLWAMRWPPFPTDMNAWIAWGEHVLRAGPSGFYTDTLFSDYAPGYVYVMWLTAAIKHTFFASADVGTYHFLYRFPPILFDLATTALIFLVVKRVAEEAPQPIERAQTGRGSLALAGIAALCYVLNPAIIINSAVWSQIDASFTFFMLLTTMLLLRGKLEGAAVSYVVAFLIKPQAISLLPVIAVLVLMRYPVRRWLVAGGIAIVIAYSILFPFLGLNAFGRLVALLNKSIETYPYTSLFTFNLWGIYGFWKDDTVQLGAGISLRLFGTLLYLVGIVYGVTLMIRQLRRTSSDMHTVFFFGTYFTFLPVMVMTRMHERYLYPVLPFLIIFAFNYYLRSLRERAAHPIRSVLNAPFLLYIAIAALHTINLYYVYLYYLYYNSGGVPRSMTFFYFIEQNARLWSVLSLLIFLAIALSGPDWSLPRREKQPQLSRIADGEPA
jgi:dolichyl-phosphate-mannose-protein mannosyltransferase